jgi:hypothetical protein
MMTQKSPRERPETVTGHPYLASKGVNVWLKANHNGSRKAKDLTFCVALDNMERMLMQIELTVIAGDQESYKISARK